MAAINQKRTFRACHFCQWPIPGLVCLVTISLSLSISPVLAPPRCLCCRLSVCQTTPVAVSAYPVCMAAGTPRNAKRNGRGLRPPSASAQSARAKTKSRQKHSSCRQSQWRTSFSKALSIMRNTAVVLGDNYGKHVT